MSDKDTTEETFDDEVDEVLNDADELLNGDEPVEETTTEADSEDDPLGWEDGPVDDEPPEETNSAADRIGSGIASGIVGVTKTAATIPLAVLNHLPKGVAIGQALHKAGINVIRKNGDAQFVAYTIYGDGEMIPRPAGIDSETQWVETDNGEEWVAENGVDLCRVGDAPVAFGVADDHEMVSPIRARLAEKIDSGGENWRVIREHDTGHVEDVNYGRVPAAGGAAANGARADGGMAKGPMPTENLTPEFDDVWVDLSNWVNDADGMVVSMKKAYETTHQKGSSEALNDAETRGRIAERFNDNQTKWAIYLVMALLGGLLLGLFGPALAQNIAGSAGGAGGGGGISPLIANTVSMWV